MLLSRGSLVPLSNLLPLPVGITGSAGSSLLAARADHVHAAGALTGSSGVVWTAGTLWADVYAEASSQVPNRIIVPNDNTDRHITPGSYDLSQIAFVAEARVTTSGARAPIIVDNNVTLTGGLHLERVHFKFTCTTVPAITASTFLDIALYDAQISNNVGATKEPIVCPAGVTSQQIRLYDGSKIGDSGGVGVGIVKLSNGAAITVLGLAWAWIDTLAFTTPGAASITYEYDSSTATAGTPFAAGITLTETLLDGADLIGYTPSTPGNWSSAPSRVSEALDDLAAQVGSGTGSGAFVHIAGTETITGAKTFNAGTVIASGQALSSTGDLKLAGASLSRVIFLSNTTERMRMSSQGTLSIGTTTEMASSGNILLPNGGGVNFLNSLSAATAALYSASDDVVLSALRVNGTAHIQADTLDVRDTGVNTYLTVTRSAGVVSSARAASTNSVLDQVTLNRKTTGTAAAGIGAGILTQLQNTTGTAVDATRVASSLTTATAGSEEAQLAFSTLSGGSVTDRLIVRQGVVIYDGTISSSADPGAGNFLIGNNRTIFARKADNSGNYALLKLDSTNTVTIGDSGASIGPITVSSTDTRVMSGATVRALVGSNLLVVGNGASDASASPGAPTIRAPNVQTGNLNVAGVTLTVAAGAGTGTGTPGNLLLQTTTALGSGSTVQSLTTRMTVGLGVMVNDGVYTTASDPGYGNVLIGNAKALYFRNSSNNANLIGIWADSRIRVGSPSANTMIEFGTSLAFNNGNYVGNLTVNSFVLGDNALDNSATPGSPTLRAPNVGAFDDTAGASFTLAAGAGTGTGTPGNLLFKTTTALTTGSTVQSLSTRLTVGAGVTVNDGTITADPGYGNLLLGNTKALYGRNAANGANLAIGQIDSSNYTVLGNDTSPNTQVRSNGETNLFVNGIKRLTAINGIVICDSVMVPTTTDPGLGNIVFGNNKAVLFRNAANSNSAELLKLDSSNIIRVGPVGGSITNGMFFDTGSGGSNGYGFGMAGRVDSYWGYRTGVFVFGANAQDNNASPGSATIRAPHVAAGNTNVAAATLTLATGAGTGSGAQALLSFQTNAVSTTGSTVQSLTTRLAIGAGLMVGGVTSDPGFGHIALPNGGVVYGRNSGNSAYVALTYLDSSNVVNFGATSNSMSLNASTYTFNASPAGQIRHFINGTAYYISYGNVLVIGASALDNNATPGAGAIRAPNVVAGTTDGAAAGFSLITGAGTGAGAQAFLSLQTNVVSTTGTTVQSTASRLTIGAGIIVNDGTLTTAADPGYGNVIIGNNKSILGRNAANNGNFALLGINGSNLILVGSPSTALGLQSNSTVDISTYARFNTALMVLGTGTADNTATPTGGTVRSPHVVTGTTDGAAAGFTHGTGLGTGAGAQASHVFQTNVVSTTGSTQQSYATRMTIGAGVTINDGTVTADPGYGNLLLGNTKGLLGRNAANNNSFSLVTIDGNNNHIFGSTSGTYIARSGGSFYFLTSNYYQAFSNGTIVTGTNAQDNTASPGAGTIRAPHVVAGTLDGAAAGLTHATGLGTGAGAQATQVFQTNVVSTSATTQQAYATRMSIATGVLIGSLSTSLDPGAGSMVFGNAKTLYFRNAADNASIPILNVDASNVLNIGNNTTLASLVSVNTSSHWFQTTSGSVSLVPSTLLRVIQHGTSQPRLYVDVQSGNVYLGGDDTGTPASAVIRGANASGTNITAPTLTIQSGAGTGNTTASTISFGTPTAGSSGSTVQTISTRMTIGAGLMLGSSTTDPGAGNILLPNGGALLGRNAANTANLNLITSNGSNQILVGQNSGNFTTHLLGTSAVYLDAAGALVGWFPTRTLAQPDTGSNGQSMTVAGQNGVTITDAAGGSLVLRGGQGTGAGAASTVNIRTPTVLSTGTTAQTATDRFVVGQGVMVTDGVYTVNATNDPGYGNVLVGNTKIVYGRNAANNANVQLLTLTSSNVVQVGATSGTNGTSILVSSGSTMTVTNNSALFLSVGPTTMVGGTGAQDNTASPGSMTIRAPNVAAGNTDVAGAAMTLATGAGTGAGAQAFLALQTNVVSTTASTVQSLTSRLTLGAGVMVNDGVFSTAADPGAGNLLLGNNKTIYIRNAGNSANIRVAQIDTGNTLYLGSTSGGILLQTSSSITFNNTNSYGVFTQSLGVFGFKANDDSATPGAYTLRTPHVVAGTTDGAAVGFTFATGLGTGAGAQAFLTFQTNTVSTSASTQQAYTTRLTLGAGVMVNDGVFTSSAADPGAGHLLLGNNKTIYFRNTANNANHAGLSVDNNNNLTVGAQGSIGFVTLAATTGSLGTQGGFNWWKLDHTTGLLVVGKGSADNITAPLSGVVRAPSVTTGVTNYAAPSLTLGSGLGSGSGAQGTVIFQTSVVGSSGTTVQTFATRGQFGAGFTIGSSGTDPGAGNLRVEGSELVTTTTAATSGVTTVAAPTTTLRGAYWTGSASASYDSTWTLTPSTGGLNGTLNLTMSPSSWRVAQFNITSGAQSTFILGDSHNKAVALSAGSGGSGFEYDSAGAFYILHATNANVGAGTGTIDFVVYPSNGVATGGLSVDPGAGNVLLKNAGALQGRTTTPANLNLVSMSGTDVPTFGNTTSTQLDVLSNGYVTVRCGTAHGLIVSNGTTQYAKLDSSVGLLVVGAGANDNQSAPGSGTVRAPSVGSGVTNYAAPNLTVGSGLGSGSGAQGTIIFQTNVVGSSGTTIQSYSTRMTLGAGLMIGTSTDPGAGLLGLSNGVLTNNAAGAGAFGLQASSGSTGVAGKDAGIVSGAGWAASGANATAGGNVYAVAQDGGNGSGTFTAGAGGSVNIQSGKGGNGTASVAPAAGGGINITANNAGSTGAFGGGANGGTVSIDGGQASGTGTAGSVAIGTAQASAVTIGRSGVTTTFNGPANFQTYVEMKEISNPATPASGQARFYVRNVSGKTQFCAIFDDGSIVVIAESTA